MSVMLWFLKIQGLTVFRTRTLKQIAGTSILFLAALAGSGCGNSSNELSNPNTAEPEGSETPDEDNNSSNAGNIATSGQPNFLLIITDDQGLDASAQYSVSGDLPNTPVIDQLAADGITFDNMWATPSCTTTRGSLISGSHGINSGVDTTPSLMDTNTLTLQKQLKTGTATQQYASAVFGKWHLAGNGSDLLHPNNSGVDYYAGNIAGTISNYYNWPASVNGVQQTSTVYHTTEITDMAIDWINQQQGAWFSWVAYVAPHSPFHLPPSNLQNRILSGTDEDIANNPRDYFLASIEAMDSEIGRLLDNIPADERDNTIVMVLGDNGSPRAVIDTNAFPRSHGKNSLYEGGIRVPFVVSGANIISRNVREPALVNTVDIFPTLSEAAGIALPDSIDGVSFFPLLSGSDESQREYNYSEFIGDSVTGWVVRDAEFKLIQLADGSRELYDLRTDLREENNLIDQVAQYQQRIAQLDAFAAAIRNTESTTPATETPAEATDISNIIPDNSSANCKNYADNYTSSALDVNNNTRFTGSLQITIDADKCRFTTNAIPNHDFNDGVRSFPNTVEAQDDTYTITANPGFATTITPLSLTLDNALLLNGVKVDILAAACFGVGDGRVGCNDPDQLWRYDPMFAANGFRVDTQNAHTQPDGTYHYHGIPRALLDDSSQGQSPVVGFAADGFPIYGSYFNDNGGSREARSSYRLKTETRPSGDGNPGGTPDGTYRDDYEYVDGFGDLDQCNGMIVNGTYGYYMTEEFPYILSCFRGTPDTSFFK